MTATKSAVATQRRYEPAIGAQGGFDGARPVFVDESGRRAVIVRFCAMAAVTAAVGALAVSLLLVLGPSPQNTADRHRIVGGAVRSLCGGALPASARVELVNDGAVVATAALGRSGEYSFLLPSAASGYSFVIHAGGPAEVTAGDASKAVLAPTAACPSIGPAVEPRVNP